MYAARRRSEPRSDTYLVHGHSLLRPVRAAANRSRVTPAPALKPYGDGSVRRDYRCGPSANGRGCGKISVDQRGLDEAAGAIAVAILSDSRHAEAVESVTRELESESRAAGPGHRGG